MRCVLLLVLLSALVAGCGQPARRPSALQSLDAAGDQLRQATSASAAASASMGALRARVARGQSPRARLEAVRLKALGWRLEVSARQARRSLALVQESDLPARAGRYVRLLLACLDAQVGEGLALVDVADLVWLDPLMMSPGGATRLLAAQSRAAHYAARAVRVSAAARALKRQHAAAFRFLWTAVSLPRETVGAPRG